MTEIAVRELSTTDFRVADLSLAEFGRREITLAEHEMPGLMAMRREFGDEQPLRGARITGSLHMTIQTAVLIETLVGARRGGAVGVLQHLLDPGSRRRGGRRRPRRHVRAAERRARVRVEGRDAGGVLVVHRAGADLAGRRPEHAARRRRRRHDARAQGPRVREGGRGARSRLGRVGGVPGLPRACSRRRSRRMPASGRRSRRTSAA